MIGLEKPTYKKEIGKVKIEYACGHEFTQSFHVQLHRSGRKTLSFTVNADDDFSICPACKYYNRTEQEKKDGEKA